VVRRVGVRAGWRTLFLLLVAACALVLTGCGADETPPRANPVPPAGLVPSDFVNLPKPGSALPLDAPVESATAIAQSFMVSGLGPQGVIDFYARELPPAGWIPRRVEILGRTAVRGSWKRGDHVLEAAASAADGVESAGPTQLDLVLRIGTAERA
jgi:hypothetical protein